MTLSSEWIFREPNRNDGAGLYKLIEACPPLDLNSSYLYFLLSDHFRQSTVVVEHDGKLLGAITAYLRPDKTDTLFVWQVAVHEKARGQGLATRMLDSLTERPALSNIRWIETTISPSNKASRRLFASWADKKQVEIKEQTYLEADDFPRTSEHEGHESECLFRIGPLSENLT